MSDMAFVDWQRKAVRRFGVAPIFSTVRSSSSLARRRILTASLLGAGLSVAGLLTMLSLAARPSGPADVRVRASTKPATPAWIDIVKPIEAFNLEASDFAKAARSYTARRTLEGGRQDVIMLGTPGAGPALRLTLYRRGAEPYRPAPLFAAIARQAADAGLSVARSGLADVLATRFGPFEVTDVMLSSGTGRPFPCRGFRLDREAPALTIAGLACGAPAVIDRKSLGCLLERLDVTSGGSDRTLIDFFANSELKRDKTCSGMRLAPDELHAAWLDDRPATPRRNSRRH